VLSVQAAGWMSDTASRAIVLVAAVASGAILMVAIDRRPAGALGFPLERRAVPESAAGFGLGGGVLALTVLLLVATGSARWLADEGTASEFAAALALSLAQFVIAAAAEEAVSRGYVFQVLVQGVGAWPAVVGTSVLFSLGHWNNPNIGWIAFANIFLAGVMLAVVYLRTRSLWIATAVHAGWNWVMSALLDFPVSGLQMDTPLYDARETGADWWTGGPFGPEAGLAATLVLVAATLWLLRTPRLRESAAMRARRPLVDVRLGPDWPRAGDRSSGSGTVD
jgi:uncharacterized protein